MQPGTRSALVSAATVAGLVLVVVGLVPGAPGREDLPAFPGDVAERKAAFFDYLRPVIGHYNGRIQRDRDWLLEVSADGSLGWLDRRRLRQLAKKYRLDTEAKQEQEIVSLLMRRVDTIPESLVLVQAAKESGWGRSRFARKGNALFGQWCYERGCGMVPKNRADGMRHEVAAFDTVGDAVESYLMNLNTHDNYLNMRMARHRLRQQGRPVTGSALAAHLGAYSERRSAYVAEIRAMIRQNDLE